MFKTHLKRSKKKGMWEAITLHASQLIHRSLMIAVGQRKGVEDSTGPFPGQHSELEAMEIVFTLDGVHSRVLLAANVP